MDKGAGDYLFCAKNIVVNDELRLDLLYKICRVVLRHGVPVELLAARNNIIHFVKGTPPFDS